MTIVWIAKQFTDEHRAALDWLNSKTEVNISFFGLEVELWRIGNSEPAPKFNIVSKSEQMVEGCRQGFFWDKFIDGKWATANRVLGTVLRDCEKSSIPADRQQRWPV